MNIVEKKIWKRKEIGKLKKKKKILLSFNFYENANWDCGNFFFFLILYDPSQCVSTCEIVAKL